jgi:hypothetical protein
LTAGAVVTNSIADEPRLLCTTVTVVEVPQSCGRTACKHDQRHDADQQAARRAAILEMRMAGASPAARQWKVRSKSSSDWLEASG